MRSEKAAELKRQGYNCCQSVLAACKDLTDLSEDDLMKLGSTFCVGMGNLEGNCGSLIAAEMILGLNKYDGWPLISKSKELQESFKEKCGSITCKELKTLVDGKPLCPCIQCVINAVDSLEEILDKE